MPRLEKWEGGQIPMGIRLPKGLYEELQARSIATGMPIAEQFRRALRFWFDEYTVPGTRPATLVDLRPSRAKGTKKGAKKR